MNLLVKRIGQLTITAALFFLSCEDPDLQGFKAKERFNVNYIEIPLNSSVFLCDSLVTSSWYANTTYLDGTPRHLLGKYDDPEFGTITSSIYGQIYFDERTGIPDSTALSMYDSASLQIRLDYNYLYGPTTINSQEVLVYELDEVLATDLPHVYFNKSNINLKPSPIGSFSYEIDPVDFKRYSGLKLSTDTILKTAVDSAKVIKRTLLSSDLGLRIFNELVNFDNATDSTDSAKIYRINFAKEIKGLALVPQNSDKMSAVNLYHKDTKLVIHFHHNVNNKRDSIILAFSGGTTYNTGGVNFIKIDANRSASELSEVTAYKTEYFPSTNKRYIQNGAGITTQLNFDPFLQFVDTIPNMIINSAELIINDVTEYTDSLAPPSALALRVMNPDVSLQISKNTSSINNKISQYRRTLYSNYFGTGMYEALNPYPDKDNPVYSLTNKYNSLAVASEQYSLTGSTQNNVFFTMLYSKETNSYRGTFTLFLQELYKNRNSDNILSKLALFPLSKSPSKSVDRVSFSQDNIKLRIYYTLPTIDKID